MKKIILIAFLFVANFCTAQVVHGVAASRMFKDADVWRWRDSVVTGYNYTLNSAPTPTLSNDNVNAMVRFWKDLKGHANYKYSTSVAIGVRLDTCFYALFPFIGTTEASIIQGFFLFNETNTEKYTVFNRLGLIGSPTISVNGITFNGVNQGASLDIEAAVGPTPKTILSAYRVGVADVAKQTNYNHDLWVRDSAGSGYFGAYKDQDKYSAIFCNPTLIRSVSFDNYAGQGQLDLTQPPTNNRGLLSQNRNGLLHKVHKNGVLINSLTNSSYNFGNPNDIDFGEEISKLSVFSLYLANTIQFASIRKRAFTDTEMTLYYNAVNELQKNLNR